MPTELIKEFIGKVCSIAIMGDFGSTGKIIAVEGNWIKVQENKKVRLINGDLIKDISILPEKYQK